MTDFWAVFDVTWKVLASLALIAGGLLAIPLFFIFYSFVTDLLHGKA